MAQKIVYEQENGVIAVVHPTGEVSIDVLASSVVPSDTPYEIVDESIIPSDRTFRGAWKATNVGITSITTEVYEDLVASKEIAHVIRRQNREEEFIPYDNVIMKQIPGSDAVAAEASREEIRVRYSGIQSAIEASPEIVSLKQTLVDHSVVVIAGISTSVGVGSTSVGVGST